jgi:hypothetical protein
MSKLLKKGSKAAKAWGAKMRRLRGGGKKRKTTTRKRRTTRKGDLTLKRKKAFSSKSKRKSNKPRKKSNSMKMPKVPSILKKVAIGLGAATLASMAVGVFAPQFVPIARPVAAFIGGGIPGVAAELVIDQGLLGNITSIFSGGGINETRLASGL